MKIVTKTEETPVAAEIGNARSGTVFTRSWGSIVELLRNAGALQNTEFLTGVRVDERGIDFYVGRGDDHKL